MLRAILVSIDNQNWQHKDLLGSGDGLSNIRTSRQAMFLPPLEVTLIRYCRTCKKIPLNWNRALPCDLVIVTHMR